MSLLAFLGGRHDKKAWGRALFASGCRLPAKPDVKRYRIDMRIFIAYAVTELR